MPKRHPSGAISRQCETCHQTFKPMTEKAFEWNWRSHVTSIHHQKYVALATSKPPSPSAP